MAVLSVRVERVSASDAPSAALQHAAGGCRAPSASLLSAVLDTFKQVGRDDGFVLGWVLCVSAPNEARQKAAP
jgi:hypothetical protein